MSDEHAADCDIRLFPFDVCSCGKEKQLADEGYIYKPESQPTQQASGKYSYSFRETEGAFVIYETFTVDGVSTKNLFCRAYTESDAQQIIDALNKALDETLVNPVANILREAEALIRDRSELWATMSGEYQDCGLSLQRILNHVAKERALLTRQPK